MSKPAGVTFGDYEFFRRNVEERVSVMSPLVGDFHAYTLADCPGTSSGSGRTSRYKSRAEWTAYFKAKSLGEFAGAMEILEKGNL